MNIPKGYKLVPVELLERVVRRKNSFGEHHLAQHDLINFLAAPTTSQPIFDEAKERELFEVWALEEIGQYFNKHEDCLVRTDHGGYVYGQTITSWLAWLACAQSRAKAWEMGHE